MKHRRRHSLDLLPLLDVFMVVLFVFATIQEGQLGATTEAAAAQQRELAALRERVAVPVVDAAEAERLRQAAQASAAGEAELRQAMAELRSASEQAAARAPTSGAEALRRQDVLTRLLDHFSVFEIEVDGEITDTGVINHCCYRTDPLAEKWTKCGSLPAVTAELTDWLASGGGGLVEALRKTRGGNALTIVRQNERATWRIGRKLEEQLRERLPDHKIYGEGVAAHAMACTR